MKKNRFLSILLSLTMAFMCVPTGMFAEGEDVVVEDPAGIFAEDEDVVVEIGRAHV